MICIQIQCDNCLKRIDAGPNSPDFILATTNRAAADGWLLKFGAVTLCPACHETREMLAKLGEVR